MHSISHGASCLIIFPGVIHEIPRYALDSFWREKRQKLTKPPELRFIQRTADYALALGNFLQFYGMRSNSASCGVK